MTGFANQFRRRMPLAVPVVVLVVASLSAGCVALDTHASKHDTPPTGPVLQVVTTWEKSIRFAPDPTHGGAPNPGLAGRLYLFGADGAFPLAGDGSLVVELYDDTPLGSSGQPMLKEQWNFDPGTLKRLLHKDTIGWGYSLFLPWGSYRRDITQIHLMVRYTPSGGTALFAPSETMAVGHPDVTGPPLSSLASQPVTPTQASQPVTPTQASQPAKPGQAAPTSRELKIG